MNNSYENLPEEYENDGNTYCHGVVNCKYFYDGECNFYAMGSGDPDDMPCLVRAKANIEDFRAWREQKYKNNEADRRCGRMKLIIDIDEEWYSNIIASKDHIDEDDEAYLILNGTPYEERPHGEWIVTAEDDHGVHRICCPFCHYEKGSNNTDPIIVTFTDFPKFCENCGAKMQKGGEKE